MIRISLNPPRVVIIFDLIGSTVSTRKDIRGHMLTDMNMFMESVERAAVLSC